MDFSNIFIIFFSFLFILAFISRCIIQFIIDGNKPKKLTVPIQVQLISDGDYVVFYDLNNTDYGKNGCLFTYVYKRNSKLIREFNKTPSMVDLAYVFLNDYQSAVDYMPACSRHATIEELKYYLLTTKYNQDDNIKLCDLYHKSQQQRV
jgi:hypothetical protein